MDALTGTPHDDGSRVPRRPARDLLPILLAGAESLIPFAVAVVEQLGAQTDQIERDTILANVVDLLRVAVDPDEDVPVKRLAANPTLLASFFQNIDLLDPAAPETDAVARLVMGAVERLDWSGV